MENSRGPAGLKLSEIMSGIKAGPCLKDACGFQSGHFLQLSPSTSAATTGSAAVAEPLQSCSKKHCLCFVSFSHAK